MIQYVVLSAQSASGLQKQVNEYAADGYMVSQFSVSNAKNQYREDNLFACVMERQK